MNLRQQYAIQHFLERAHAGRWQLLERHLLACEYLYRVHNISVVTDSWYDQNCADLSRTPSQYAASASSGNLVFSSFEEDYPPAVRSAAWLLLSDKHRMELERRLRERDNYD